MLYSTNGLTEDILDDDIDEYDPIFDDEDIEIFYDTIQ